MMNQNHKLIYNEASSSISYSLCQVMQHGVAQILNSPRPGMIIHQDAADFTPSCACNANTLSDSDQGGCRFGPYSSASLNEVAMQIEIQISIYYWNPRGNFPITNGKGMCEGK